MLCIGSGKTRRFILIWLSQVDCVVIRNSDMDESRVLCKSLCTAHVSRCRYACWSSCTLSEIRRADFIGTLPQVFPVRANIVINLTSVWSGSLPCPNGRGSVNRGGSNI